MVRSGGNIKIYKHNQGKKLLRVMEKLKELGYITRENGQIKFNEQGNQLELELK